MNCARMISITWVGRDSPSSIRWIRIFVIRCSMSLFIDGLTKSKNVLKNEETNVLEELPISLMMTIHFVCSRILRM